ncbi:galactosylceramide sulfotransferase [Carassius auratus]|uniref:Galactosylceramide sulfotransferase-like n=1 Tax=Carassius auratus TaxID=7957 RepID=A0A6P6QCX1_CARAU|nr:galactosylceramide sulfotransferase-like [Carassius auratus]XP_026129889.1 galactosylceramide sulfotransferase-like [Carassius auratus]XP_026129890.1 galactosylceramide sulfotransferase-like [Carassius auratus]XP_052424230.1 galactosylceramide sulfotransferase [Carassius gibelio]XP_052424231.1 galactosylceramide sulfotransferase [Carassius gibelio]XP_052424232.1 galactosylceramide sulfotransferase [Carassius gibelio]XP_052424233.1 galactosylceramide sulfotransferase [Carassius gibelio]XP_
MGNRLIQKLFLGMFVICMMGFYCLKTSTLLATHSVSLAPCASKVRNNSQRTLKADVTCSPKVNLMFMKTHKTASSTLMNVLLRFGEKHQLRFALPDGRNDFFYPSSFFRTQVKSYQPGLCYNIVCNHMRFNAPEVEKLLPEDAFFFTILRDPAELFESSFHYYKAYVPQTWRIPGGNQFEEFLVDPNRYYNPQGINAFYLKNLQFFDFGFENNLEADDVRVQESIEYMEKRFQLVLISDHFEESLILLKDALCWQMDDLLFFKLNVRNATSVSPMSPELRTRAREWNGADWRLYQHFNTTFWALVEAYGRSRMEEEVKELRRRNAEMEAICIDGGGAVEAAEITDRHMKPWQPIGKASILGYNLKSDIKRQYEELCRKMLTPEIQYLTDLGVNLWVTRLWGWFKDSVVQFGLS